MAACEGRHLCIWVTFLIVCVFVWVWLLLFILFFAKAWPFGGSQSLLVSSLIFFFLHFVTITTLAARATTRAIPRVTAYVGGCHLANAPLPVLLLTGPRIKNIARLVAFTSKRWALSVPSGQPNGDFAVRTLRGIPLPFAQFDSIYFMLRLSTRHLLRVALLKPALVFFVVGADYRKQHLRVLKV